MRQGLVVTVLMFAIGIPTVLFTDGWSGFGVQFAQLSPGHIRAVSASTGAPQSGANGSGAGDWLAGKGMAAAVAVGRGAAQRPYKSVAGALSTLKAKAAAPAAGDSAAFGEKLQEVEGTLKTANVAATNMDVDIDYGAAVKWYALANDVANPEARYAIALDFLSRTPDPDYGSAARWLRSAAEIGFARAQLTLAGLYVEGKGVARDYPIAFMWYTLAEHGLETESDVRLALDKRARLTAAMTPEERAAAVQMIDDWQSRIAAPDLAPAKSVPVVQPALPLDKVAAVELDAS